MPIAAASPDAVFDIFACPQPAEAAADITPELSP